MNTRGLVYILNISVRLPSGLGVTVGIYKPAFRVGGDRTDVSETEGRNTRNGQRNIEILGSSVFAVTL